MTADAATPLTIWAVSDGRAGMRDQVVGLAEAVARKRPSRVSIKTIGWRAGIGRLPNRFNLAPRLTLSAASRITPPWPDLWIAAGRATLPLSTRMRRWSGGGTFVVQTQDPRMDLAAFDLVIPPEHDGLAGPQAFPILGAPHGVTAVRLATEAVRFAAAIDPLPHPRVAVLIGGTSKAFDLPPARAWAMAGEIEQALQVSQGSLLLTFSRRTPEQARTLIAERLSPLPGIIWDETGDNPFHAFLGAADVILVTEDSANMAAQAAATGKPVMILKMAGESAKFRRFHEDLTRRGVSRPFDGRLETWTYAPLAETDRAADEVLRRLGARR